MSRWAPVALAVARCGGDPAPPDAASVDAALSSYQPGDPIDGYSPRIVATPTPGVFLAAWVAGAPPDHQIMVRVFARP